jgi:hypothetical protein
MVQLQQDAAHSDNQRDVSEAVSEVDPVAVVVWICLERSWRASHAALSVLVAPTAFGTIGVA